MTYKYDDPKHPRPWKIGQAPSAIVDNKAFNASAWWVKDAKGHVIGYMAGFNPDIMYLLVQNIALHNKGLLEDERVVQIDGHKVRHTNLYIETSMPTVPEITESNDSTTAAGTDNKETVLTYSLPLPAVSQMPEF